MCFKYKKLRENAYEIPAYIRSVVLYKYLPTYYQEVKVMSKVIKYILSFIVVLVGAVVASVAFSAAPAEAISPGQGHVANIVAAENSDGYWISRQDGAVSSHGAISSFNTTNSGMQLNQPIVGGYKAANRQGFWQVATDGGVFAWGEAPFAGSMGGKHLNQPMVGVTSTKSGNGYWTVASDGGIFSFGDAGFYGSMGGTPLNKPVVAMARVPSGNGYWLVASDGGVFAFGDAPFYGSLGSTPLNQPIVGMATTPSGKGYWLVAKDGGVFTYGDAPFYGSMGGQGLDSPMVSISSSNHNGYWMVTEKGSVYAFGLASWFGNAEFRGEGYAYRNAGTPVIIDFSETGDTVLDGSRVKLTYTVHIKGGANWKWADNYYSPYGGRPASSGIVKLVTYQDFNVNAGWMDIYEFGPSVYFTSYYGSTGVYTIPLQKGTANTYALAGTIVNTNPVGVLVRIPWIEHVVAP